MTESAQPEQFHAPHNEEEVAGRLRYRQAPTPYEQFMAEQEIPVHSEVIGVRDSRDLVRAPWKRMGGQGAFIYMRGTTGRGMYVVEVPAAGELNAERHLYEELFYVVEGRGSTEVWRDAGGRKQSFEWQAGSLFSIPINTWHRLVNATSSPALVIGVTSAPSVLNLFHNPSFVFDNPYDFTDRYDEDQSYFTPRQDLEPHPITGRAVLRSTVIPDIAHCELPLDNQRSPGYRRIEPHMAGNEALHVFIGQHGQGRYAKAHRGEGGGSTAPVLVCIGGRGYTFTWPHELGLQPWADGKGDQVIRQEYVPGGLVCSSPVGGGWFHAHYGVGAEPLRFLALLGGAPAEARRRDPTGEGDALGGDVISANADIRDGGLTIGYDVEDPYVLRTFRGELAREGVSFEMPESSYAPRESGVSAAR